MRRCFDRIPFQSQYICRQRQDPKQKQNPKTQPIDLDFQRFLCLNSQKFQNHKNPFRKLSNLMSIQFCNFIVLFCLFFPRIIAHAQIPGKMNFVSAPAVMLNWYGRLFGISIISMVYCWNDFGEMAQKCRINSCKIAHSLHMRERTTTKLFYENKIRCTHTHTRARSAKFQWILSFYPRRVGGGNMAFCELSIGRTGHLRRGNGKWNCAALQMRI